MPQVVRVEMQSLKRVESTRKPEKLTMLNTFKYIYQGMASSRTLVKSLVCTLACLLCEACTC